MPHRYSWVGRFFRTENKVTWEGCGQQPGISIASIDAINK